MALNPLLQRVIQTGLCGLWPKASRAGPHHFRVPSFYFNMWEEKQPLLGWITKNTFLSTVSVWSPEWKERKVLDSLHCSSASTGQPGRTPTIITPRKKSQNTSGPKVFSSANTSKSLYVVPKFLGPAGSIEIKIFQLIKVVETIAGIPHDKLQILQEALLTSLAPSSEMMEEVLVASVRVGLEDFSVSLALRECWVLQGPNFLYA